MGSLVRSFFYTIILCEYIKVHIQENINTIEV